MKKLKTFLSLIAVTLLSFFTSNAQELENSTLWKISGNGLEKPSYLFGTIHMTCDATLDADVKKALDETSQVVLEIDMDDPTIQSKAIKGTYMKDGKSLKDLISEDDFLAVDKMFKENIGISVTMMQTMKPFFLTAALYPKLLDCPVQSFEAELLKVAKAQGEDVKGLETIEDQMAIFEAIPYEDQAKDLVRSAKDNLADDKKTFSKMLEVYKSENITEMVNMMKDDSESSIANHQDKLLDNRNKNWIPKIAEMAKDQPSFFGVGAGHLAGKNGVIKLLRNAGYSVKAVK